MPLNGNLPQQVDVLIVGSGFGGSVMAAELARKRPVKAGEPPKICLVERGRAYPPGSFPRDPAGISRNFWDPKAKLYGMFHVASFKKMDVVVSSGLGGGSLIYANVMLRKDATWFKQRVPIPKSSDCERWLLTAEDLEPHYQSVLDFLKVQELPHADSNPEFRLVKTSRFLQNSAQALIPTAASHPANLNDAVAEFEDTAGYAPLAVRFRVDGVHSRAAVGAPLVPETYGNLHDGVHRTTCTLIGECDVGCNQGAKNTLDHTYLSEASHNGVSIHTLTEVVWLQHDPEADYPFTITVQRHHPPAEDYGVDTVREEALAYPPPPSTDADPDVAKIRARRVVLAAGTLGTATLLLRHQEALRIRTAGLGTRFSGNGDFLGFVHGVDGRLDCTRGPVITAFRRYPADTDPHDRPGTPDTGNDGSGELRHGMYIEDAGYPAFAAWLVQLGQAGTMGKSAFRTWLQRKRAESDPDGTDDHSNMSEELHEILADGAFSAKAMPLLGMGRDVPSGTFSLEGGSLQCDWTAEPSMGYFDSMIRRMRTIAAGMGGNLLANPLYTLIKRGITVHPVGGCPMDTTSDQGIVDSYGRVRDVPGLRVCDGSVFPGPIGPNPSLTIAAFARRCALDLLEENWKADPSPIPVYDPQAWESKHPEPTYRGRLRRPNT